MQARIAAELGLAREELGQVQRLLFAGDAAVKLDTETLAAAIQAGEGGDPAPDQAPASRDEDAAAAPLDSPDETVARILVHAQSVADQMVEKAKQTGREMRAAASNDLQREAADETARQILAAATTEAEAVTDAARRRAQEVAEAKRRTQGSQVEDE